MMRRMAVAVLAASTVMGSVLLAATAEHPGFYDGYAQDVARDARHAAQAAMRAARRAAREAAQLARDSAREARLRARDQARTARAFDQGSRNSDDPCGRDRGDRDRGRACEVRDTRLPAPVGALTVDASPNGGISVEGWDQADVLVRAVVQTYGDTDAEAKALLPSVQVRAAGTSVSAEGPLRGNDDRGQGWSVSFRIWAPRATALALSARNGGISVRAMRGESRFTTENGGVTLDDVAGQVVGTTRNGGVNVRLSGAQWDGAGLDVETTNGGVTLTAPANFSAALEVATVNGGIRSDFPAAMPSDRRSREVRATLGSGGPLLKLRTVNGGVRLQTRD